MSDNIILTHWGLVTHIICISKLGRHWFRLWLGTNNDGLLLIGPLGTHFNAILIKIQFSLTKMLLKILSAKWWPICLDLNDLTHWGLETHICVGKLTIIASDNGLSPGRHQAIIWTNAGILLIGPLGTNFSEIWIGIQIFSLKKIHLKLSSGKWRPSCLGLNVLKPHFVQASMN